MTTDLSKPKQPHLITIDPKTGNSTLLDVFPQTYQTKGSTIDPIKHRYFVIEPELTSRFLLTIDPKTGKTLSKKEITYGVLSSIQGMHYDMYDHQIYGATMDETSIYAFRLNPDTGDAERLIRLDDTVGYYNDASAYDPVHKRLFLMTGVPHHRAPHALDAAQSNGHNSSIMTVDFRAKTYKQVTTHGIPTHYAYDAFSRTLYGMAGRSNLVSLDWDTGRQAPYATLCKGIPASRGVALDAHHGTLYVVLIHFSETLLCKAEGLHDGPRGVRQTQSTLPCIVGHLEFNP